MEIGNQFLGTERIDKLMRQYAVPCIISLLVGALYNIVDQIFIANASYLGSYGNAANTVVFPLTVVALAIAVMVGDGCCAFVSMALGRNETARAKRSVGNAVVLIIVGSLILTAVYLIFANSIIAMFGGTVNEETYRHSQEYFFYITLGIPFYMFGQAMNPIIRADGNPKFAMISTLAGAVINIILDPIFIFGWFGLPRMETAGAALATVIGQFMGCLAGMLINKKWNPEIPFAFTLKPDWESVREIIKVGFPSTLVQIFTSVVNMAMNAIVITFSSTAVAAFGICTKIQNITTVGVHGITNGLIPIVAYNYGAKQKERIRQSIRYGILYGGGLFLIFFAVLESCPGFVLKLFDASDNLMNIGVPALRILAVAYLLSIPGLIYQASLQGLSLGKESMYISMTRQAILPLVFAFILKWFGNLNLIWVSFVLAELCGIPLAMMLWKRKGEKQRQF